MRVEKQKALLVLEDGASFPGTSVGAGGRAAGEVVFHTGMTGYQEIVTDPSHRGLIVAMTYPLIGNYGVNTEDAQSSAAHVRGLVVNRMCHEPSNFRSEGRLAQFLQEHGIVAMEGVDTRALTRHIRRHGSLRGVIAVGDEKISSLVTLARETPRLENEDLVGEVSCRQPYVFAEGRKPTIVVVDYGVKRGILRSLARRGWRVLVVPGRATAEDVLAANPVAVVLSNGPGDPTKMADAVSTVKALLGKVKLLGICLGHHVLAHALGAESYRMANGHRGANHPVKDLASGRVYITAQSHGFAVREGSWTDPDVVVTHRHVHDRTVEGFMHKGLGIMGIQYAPEASPGPSDSQHLYDVFLSDLEKEM